MKQMYEIGRFAEKTMDKLYIVEDIVDDLAAHGLVPTLRQLYYQLVARDVIKNNQKEYVALGSMLSRARNLGLLDWNAITDRTRTVNFSKINNDPDDLIRRTVNNFCLDMWEDQEYYVEVYVEKQAQEQVIAQPSIERQAPYLSCKGYISTSVAREAGVRIKVAADKGKKPIIIHLGDHDPSGLHMTQNIADRLAVYSEYSNFEVHRIALNYSHVEKYGIIPNKTNPNNPLAKEYMQKYPASYELDALHPRIINKMIAKKIEQLLDLDKWNARFALQEEQRADLAKRMGLDSIDTK